MFCVQTSHLSFSFSAGTPVLSDIALEVPRGSIYGFLGPNGAGKTTTLRLLLGLIKKQQGDIRIFGRSLEQERIEILRDTGSMIESPSLYAHLTAKENLQLLRKIYQCSQTRINEVLTIVGLPDTGNKKVSQFSLGMKQRLSIAVALLHSPSLLILDEPTNGLDPYGMIEIRDLLKKLNRQHGVTIIISSHLLSEIEKLVTHLGIISKGSMVFQGTLQELREKQYAASKTSLHCSDTENAREIIAGMDIDGTLQADRFIMPVLTPVQIAALNRRLVQHGIDVFEISTVNKDLETIFMDLINRS